ncbi:Uncharacterised protein [Mycobacteroides abscessus subsp. massiliense]|uniref:hypothetical protein n=1 Tax=Mycobacteroides abscessus TaxID=36809 RepID=UPI0009A63D9D|nr:hypothetical protein [Mycobacteroides abscessus]SLH42727.1 Uncharacterised protein [Mycobacteroides abscessus subsp. massiliense]
MNTKKHHLIPAGVAALAAATMLTTACGTATEPTATPSSSASASPNHSAVRDLRLARAEEGKRELRLNVAAAIPHTVDREYAAAAASDGTPFIFSYGGCAWMRMPDKSLYNLHGAGGSLTRDTAAEREFGSWPGSGERHVCEPATGIPDADNPSVTAPYRWIGERGFQRLRVNGSVYALPGEIPEAGTVLREAVDHGPAPTNGEVVPGVPSTYPN